MIHAAPIKLVGFSVFADGQTIHKPLLEIVLVLIQYSFHGIVQKLQVLFQLGKVASCDGGELLFSHAEAVFVPVKVVVLTQVFSVCVVCGGLLILAGVIFFIHLPHLIFTHRPPEALIFQPLDGGL